MLFSSLGLPIRYMTSACACGPYSLEIVSRDFGSDCVAVAPLDPHAIFYSERYE